MLAQTAEMLARALEALDRVLDVMAQVFEMVAQWRADIEGTVTDIISGVAIVAFFFTTMAWLGAI